jgi:hypothetical protein
LHRGLHAGLESIGGPAVPSWVRDSLDLFIAERATAVVGGRGNKFVSQTSVILSTRPPLTDVGKPRFALDVDDEKEVPEEKEEKKKPKKVKTEPCPASPPPSQALAKLVIQFWSWGGSECVKGGR